MTTWSARILNTANSPYQWDLLDSRRAALLDQVYQVYLKTGSLTVTALPFNKKRLQIGDTSDNQTPTQKSATPANKKNIQISTRPANGKALQANKTLPKKESNSNNISSAVVASPNLRIPTNGSLKKRERKKKVAAEAAMKAAKDAAEATQAAAEAAEAVVAAVTSSTAAPVGNKHVETDPVSIAPPASTESSQFEGVPADTQSTAAKKDTECKNGTEEQLLSPVATSVPSLEIDTARLSARVPPSPPLSPGQAEETLAAVSSAFGIVKSIHSPANSDSKSDAIVDHSEIDLKEASEPLSPTASSVTLGHLSEGHAADDADGPADFNEDANDKSSTRGHEHSTQKPQNKKKPRSKKRNKRKSKTTKFEETSRDDNSRDDVEANSLVDLKANNSSGDDVEANSLGDGVVGEVNIGAQNFAHMDRNGSEMTVASTLQSVVEDFQASIKSFHSYTNAELRRGSWEPFGNRHVLFKHPDTDVGSLVLRDAKVNRHMRENARQLAQKTKPPKANSLKKARQVLMRRGQVSADSPLLRAATRPERPHHDVPKQADSDPQSVTAQDNNRTEVLAFVIERLISDDQQMETIRNSRQQYENERIIEVEEEEDVPVNEGRDEFDYQHGVEAHHLDGVESDGDTTVSNSDSLALNASSMFISQLAEGEEGQDVDFDRSGVDQQFTQPEKASNEFNDAAQHIHAQGQLDEPSPDMRAPEIGGLVAGQLSYDPTHQLSDVGPSVPEDSHSERSLQPSRRGWNCSWDRGPGQGRRRGNQAGRGDSNSAQSSYQGNGQYRGNYSWRQGSHRENYSSGPDSHPRNYTSGQGNQGDGRSSAPKGPNPADQKREAWVAAARDADRVHTAVNKERRRALLQDMESKGKTYADYDSQVEDTYRKVDEEGNFVAEDTEKIIYGPQSQAVAPSVDPFSVEDQGVTPSSDFVDESQPALVEGQALN